MYKRNNQKKKQKEACLFRVNDKEKPQFVVLQLADFKFISVLVAYKTENGIQNCIKVTLLFLVDDKPNFSVLKVYCVGSQSIEADVQ